MPSRTLNEMATILEITTSSLEIKAEREERQPRAASHAIEAPRLSPSECAGSHGSGRGTGQTPRVSRRSVAADKSPTAPPTAP